MLRLVGNSEYEDGGGVTGPWPGKACAGVMVSGAKDSAEGIQCSIFDIEAELDIRSGWLNIGRERHGLEADSGK